MGFDAGFRFTTKVFAWLTILLVASILLMIGEKAAPAITKYGLEPDHFDHLGLEPRAVRHPAGNLGHALQLAVGPDDRLACSAFRLRSF